MAPSRARAGPEDSKAEVLSTKDRLGASGTTYKVRKNAANSTNATISTKDITILNSGTAASANGTGPTNGSASMDWSSEPMSLLDKYRNAYRLETPTAFSNPLNAALLSIPGIGRHSPTMARKTAKRSIPKDQLALTVRKHFNGLAVNETDVVVDFLYKVKFQDKSFKMRFAPPKQR